MSPLQKRRRDSPPTSSSASPTKRFREDTTKPFLLASLETQNEPHFTEPSKSPSTSSSASPTTPTTKQPPEAKKKPFLLASLGTENMSHFTEEEIVAEVIRHNRQKHWYSSLSESDRTTMRENISRSLVYRMVGHMSEEERKAEHEAAGFVCKFSIFAYYRPLFFLEDGSS